MAYSEFCIDFQLILVSNESYFSFLIEPFHTTTTKTDCGRCFILNLVVLLILQENKFCHVLNKNIESIMHVFLKSAKEF